MRYGFILVLSLFLIGCHRTETPPRNLEIPMSKPDHGKSQSSQGFTFDDIYDRVTIETFDTPQVISFSMSMIGYSGTPPGIVSITGATAERSYLYVIDKAATRALRRWPPNKDSANFGIYHIRVERIYRAECRKGSESLQAQFKGAKFVEGEIVSKESVQKDSN